MSVLLDTSVVIDVLRGLPAALRFAGRLADVPFCSEVTRVEVLRGVRSGERNHTSRYLGSLRWLSVDGPIAERAGQLGRTWRRSHVGLSTPDLIVAASAQELGADLVTCNVKHFPMFQGLEPPYCD